MFIYYSMSRPTTLFSVFWFSNVDTCIALLNNQLIVINLAVLIILGISYIEVNNTELVVLRLSPQVKLRLIMPNWLYQGYLH